MSVNPDLFTTYDYGIGCGPPTLDVTFVFVIIADKWLVVAQYASG